MATSCKICNRPDRAEIEDALLNMTADAAPGVKGSIEQIAEQFGVPLDDLKMHALFHTPLVDEAALAHLLPAKESESASVPTPKDSLMRKLKLREVDMLAAVSTEYMVTLKTMGRRINRLAQVSAIDIEDEEKQVKLAKLLTKPMVDLYVGIGGEIRQTVKTMAELDRMLNGPEDSLGSGLAALAQAIQGSDQHNG